MQKMTENTNPLQKYYRQPQIYVKLPSGGKWYSPEVFTPTENGEIPILPMTAKDELAFKTPDALISGQATVDVIKSCVPNFKDPWQMVNFDTDTILLAIRIASYGETMNIDYTVPVTNEQASTTLNLPAMLEDLSKVKIADSCKTKAGFVIKLAPLRYNQLTQIILAQYEQQRVYASAVASNVNDVTRSKTFAESFKKLNELNFDMLIKSVASITTPDNVEVNDKNQIIEFLSNAPSDVVDEIQTELGKVRGQAQTPPLKIKATEEQIKKGVSATFEVPVTFDNSNFFG